MFQLLSDKVTIWNPTAKKFITRNIFMEEYGITPRNWPEVKAIAGCDSDDIPGLKGIGDKIASKFLANGIDTNHKNFKRIRHWITDGRYAANLKLTKLPYHGVKQFVPEEDEVSVKKWNKMCERMGMRSLIGRSPSPIRGFGGITPSKIRRSGET
jgi:5'-3' exonuclease